MTFEWRHYKDIDMDFFIIMQDDYNVKSSKIGPERSV